MMPPLLINARDVCVVKATNNQPPNMLSPIHKHMQT